ncbi:HprK-related kinase A [Glaciecola siphonariae]|uniref:HprK-related kinase A n=1 Tax=Glaciecola siphonariae TaxID=521012 RepID=A0ABV9LVR6_9ALTE
MRSEKFLLRLPPFTFSVSTDIPLVKDNARLIYGNACVDISQRSRDDYIDYHLSLEKNTGVRRFYKPQARFFCDGREPFKPLTHSQAFAMLEWGMNWTVAAHELQYVIVHSAVLEKNGKAILFPAPPGSGKSTLTAFLANNNWRLLSDEMALVIPQTSTVLPFVRPICLKNQSIDLCQNWFADATYSSVAKDTHKGDVIHMAANAHAQQNAAKPADIVGVVFPKYDVNTELDIYQLNMREAFMQLVFNAFNFTAIGQDSFETVTALIEKVKAFEICYSNLPEVDAFLTEEIICCDD